MSRVLTIILLFSMSQLSAQQDTTAAISGWSFGGVPAVAYTADFGLQYGALGNLYYYGDEGARYPYYDHSIYAELTTTTRNDRRIIFRYDAREMIKEGRFRAELFQRLTNFRPFYGFNGYEAFYDSELHDPAADRYVSSLYYTYKQNRINALANIEKNLLGQGKKYRLQVEGQLTYMGIDRPDVNLFNRGKSSEDQLPDTVTLYDEYIQAGIIPESQKDGGTYAQLAVGGVVDTRDIEPFPSKGVYEEVMFNYGAPLSNATTHVLAFRLNHRHYQTLVRDRLVFAHRVQFRTYFNESVPFYVLQTLGGSDDLRGIHFARIAGLGVVNATAELRAKFVQFVLFNQNIYGGVNLFFDTGRITKPVAWNSADIERTHPNLLSSEEEAWHHAAGFGFKGALNENFIVSVDYGKALDDRDGNTSLYISLGWQF